MNVLYNYNAKTTSKNQDESKTLYAYPLPIKIAGHLPDEHKNLNANYRFIYRA
jgi:hypothetical protein